MATALKDIQFGSPVLNGTTADGKTTWTYGANDVVVFGCGSTGVSCSETHYGCEEHCGCEYHHGCEYHYGYEEHHCGSYEYHCGAEYHCGTEEHHGSEYHYGNEEHCGYEEYHYGIEHHNGCEEHSSCESHSGCEYHNGYESHCGWVEFFGSCSGNDSSTYTGTNMRVYGIAVVDPTNSSNVVLLTYSKLKEKGF